MRRPTPLPTVPSHALRSTEPRCRFWQDFALYAVCCIAIASMVVW